MALIISPNCGKSVSNTVKTCVHCGCGLSKHGEERNYKFLNSSETEALQKEFHTLNPEFAEYENEAEKNAAYFNKYSHIWLIMFIACFFAIGASMWAILAIDADGSVLSAKFSEKPITYLPMVTLILGLGCFLGLLILGLVRLFLIRQLNNRLAINELIILTKYKVWLKETKNINYEITGIKDKYMDYIRDFEYDGIDKIKLKRG